MPHQPHSKGSAGNRDNEAGSLLGPTYAAFLGVSRVLSETCVVGGHSYADLADAMAQGRRTQARKGGRS
jgi:hypothetical protein